MIGFPNPQQQAWWQAVQQKNAAYQQQIDQALDLATLHQALSYPRSWGPTGRVVNPLLSPANNTATPLFQPAAPDNASLQVMNYLMNQSQPGQGGSTSFNPQLAQLLGQSGVG